MLYWGQLDLIMPLSVTELLLLEGTAQASLECCTVFTRIFALPPPSRLPPPSPPFRCPRAAHAAVLCPTIQDSKHGSVMVPACCY